jgi:alanyl-tRNA synthetase
MANGEPISQQPAPANQPKPSLLRQILGSALTGLAAGLATERPEESFAAGMAAIETARERERQRQIQQEELARQREALELRKREVDIQEKRAQAETKLIEQNIAKGNLEQLKIAKELESLEAKLKIDATNSIANFIEAFKGTGAALVTILDNDPEELNKFMKTLEAKGQDPTSAFIYVHNPATNQVFVFDRPSDALKEDLEIDTPFGKFKAPKGTPKNLVPALFSAHLSARLDEIRSRRDEQKAAQDEFNRINAFAGNLIRESQSIRNALARLISERNLTVDPNRVRQIDQEIAQLQAQLRENEEQLRAIRQVMARLTGVSGEPPTETPQMSSEEVVSKAVENLRGLSPDKLDRALNQLIDQGVLTKEQAEEVSRRLGQGTRPSSGAPDAKELLKRGRETGGAFFP